MCEETGKFRQKLFLQFMQCSLYNDFLHIRYGASIHFKPILWKNCFLPKWNEHWVEMDQTHSKGKSPQQNMVDFLLKLTGAIDVAENNYE